MPSQFDFSGENKLNRFVQIAVLLPQICYVHDI